MAKKVEKDITLNKPRTKAKKEPKKEKEEIDVEIVETQETESIKKEKISLAVFDEINKEGDLERHKAINKLFDKASKVIEDYLDDPDIDSYSKMVPAKLAVDLYLAEQKFKREDEKMELETRKLSIEEAKLSKTGNLIFNQQNNFIGNSEGDKKGSVDLSEIKKKQDKLLASFLPPKKN